MDAGYKPYHLAPIGKSHMHSSATSIVSHTSGVLASTPTVACRFCGAALQTSFIDLGMSPLCESFAGPEQLADMEVFYPLHAYVCGHCFLVQLHHTVSPVSIFTEYAYFSSYSTSWVDHARGFVETALDRFKLTANSKVVEIGSNDGYLLQHFVARGVPVLGVEPAANVAKVAIEKGVPTTVRFFGSAMAAQIAAEHGRPDLLVGNNVLAHVPDINDFVSGMKTLLAPDGVITMEFPHLSRLVEGNQFDTIYHEHVTYLSFVVAGRIFEHHGLTLFDVEELPTHGGSLRIYARHVENCDIPVEPRVDRLRQREINDGYLTLRRYMNFDRRAKETKWNLLEVLIRCRREGKTVAGYGAPGKGNTLLNYCGIRTDLIDYTVDRNPYKQGKYLPGTRIPVFAPERILETRPDYLLILPWNLKDEIMGQMSAIREWGGKFMVPIPAPALYS
jgi:SAM-dependent methyltransferase